MSADQFIGAVAMDLKRVAAALQRNSFDMAEELLMKARNTKNHIDTSQVEPHIGEILNNVDNISKRKTRMQVAETALMYGTLLQNYSLSRMNTK